MKLKNYLKHHKKSVSGFAKALGVSPSMMYAILSGERRPSASKAKKIEELTDGHVNRLEVLYPDEFGNQ